MSRQGSHVAVAVQGTDQVDSSAQTGLTAGSTPTVTLRLRGGPRNRPHVVWDEDVVDNEGLGRKKSKSTFVTAQGENRSKTINAAFFMYIQVCCIYHKPRGFDESSDEDSSETESEADDGSNARPSREYRRSHRHAHDGECDADPPRDPENKLRGGGDDRNAYEQMSHKGKGKVTS